MRDYCDTGWKKGRNPRPDFNGWAYRAHHPSAEATGIAPFVHHLARALLRGDDLAARPSIRATARRRPRRTRSFSSRPA